LQAASWLAYAGLDLAATYRLVAAGAGRPDVSLALNILAAPLWIASVAVYVLLGRIRSPRLAWIGGTLLVIGLSALATNLGTEIMTFSMVQNAIVDPMQADHATRTLESLPAVVVNIMFSWALCSASRSPQQHCGGPEPFPVSQPHFLSPSWRST
jgi:hypothetical protein